MSELNAIDQLVKHSILNYFSIFPTRLHVLTHCLLSNGTGFEWVKKEDGFLYLEQKFSRENPDDITNKIEILQINDDISKCNLTHTSSIELSNIIRNWIMDNIDVYCLKEFKAEGFNYNPHNTSYLLFRGYNRLCDIDDMSKIAPIWRDAIKEVCSHYMTLLAPIGCPYISKEALDNIRDKTNRDTYLILFNAYEKIRALHKKNTSIHEKILNKINGGKTLNELLNDDWNENFRNELTFDEFLELRKFFIKKLDIISRSDVIYYIKKQLKSKKTYINEDNSFNEFFYANYDKSIKSIGWRFFDEQSIVSSVMRYLDISDFYESRVAKIIVADMNTCYGS